MVSSNESKENRRPLLPTEGEFIPKKELCTLYREGYAYERVRIDSITYNTPPRSNFSKCHVLCQVGQGGSGKTILCTTSSGKAFVSKLFLVKPSTQYCHRDREEEDRERIAIATAKAKEECTRWRTLYPQYARFCRVIMLNGVPAFTMPYFPPVPYKERKNCLNLIKDELNRMAAKDWYYNKEDLRWRHFGYRTNGTQREITLLDLGSLATTPEDVKEQIMQLDQRKEVEEIETPKPVIACGSP